MNFDGRLAANGFEFDECVDPYCKSHWELVQLRKQVQNARDLIANWREDEKSFPNTATGLYGRSVQRFCGNDLQDALDEPVVIKEKK